VSSNGGRSALSRRELEVLRDMANGYTLDQTARRQRRAADTVKAQRSSVLLKLHARNASHAVALALRDGILQYDDIATRLGS
jgi:DNA-binding CsgD family transcriptional regulator